jgi:hypothetical protein
MMGISTYLSIISLNVNGLNFLIKNKFDRLYYKNEMTSFVAYKRCMFLAKQTNIGLELKAGIRFSKIMKPKSQQ